MPTIAVIGANGRVGSEVALLLWLSGEANVIPLVRSAYAASFLRRLGLECRIGTVTDDARARHLVGDADVVVDFSLPVGLPSQVKRVLRANLQGVLRHAPRNAPHVFISSTMAYGVDEAQRYQDYTLARSVYAATKRYGERRARVFGAAQRRPVFVLRLGEVHGELQGCSYDFKQAVLSLRGRPIALPLAGEVPCDAVFCTTIAAALLHIARGGATQGLYTMVEDPQLTLRGLYERYARALDQQLHIEDVGGSSAGGLVAGLGRAIVAQREFLTAHLLPGHPTIEQRLRGPHHLRTAAAQIAAVRAAGRYTPAHRHGAVPGERLPMNETAATATRAAGIHLRKLLHQRLGRDAHVFPLEPMSLLT